MPANYEGKCCLGLAECLFNCEFTCNCAFLINGSASEGSKVLYFTGFRAPPCCLGLAGAIFSRNFTCQLRFSHTSSLDAFLGHAKNVVTGFPGVSKNRISHEDGAKKCKNIRSKRLQIQPLKMFFLAPSSRKTQFFDPPRKAPKRLSWGRRRLGPRFARECTHKIGFWASKNRFHT